MADVQILADEINTDPLARGYTLMTDLEVANDVNTEYRTITKESVSGSEIFNATDDVEYSALTAEGKASWDRLCAIESIDTTSGVARSREAELFGAGTTTRTNLQALRALVVSRAVELNIGSVNEGDVALARTI